MKEYYQRISDKVLIEHLESKGAVLIEGEVPHLIDEWQIAPNIWNAVRYEVDKNRALAYNYVRVKMTTQNGN